MKHSDQLEKLSRKSYNQARYAKVNGTTSDSDKEKYEDNPG
jgi:hypothetical protein